MAVLCILCVIPIRFYSVPTAEKPGKLSFRAFHDYRRINYEIIIIVRWALLNNRNSWAILLRRSYPAVFSTVRSQWRNAIFLHDKNGYYHYIHLLVFSLLELRTLYIEKALYCYIQLFSSSYLSIDIVSYSYSNFY